MGNINKNANKEEFLENRSVINKPLQRKEMTFSQMQKLAIEKETLIVPEKPAKFPILDNVVTSDIISITSPSNAKQKLLPHAISDTFHENINSRSSFEEQAGVLE